MKNDISGSLGGNVDLIRSLTVTSITGSFTVSSSASASRLDNLANDIIALSICIRIKYLYKMRMK